MYLKRKRKVEKMEDKDNLFDATTSILPIPKAIATVNIAGITFTINENNSVWKEPTPEQIKNLKDTFGIEVILHNKE